MPTPSSSDRPDTTARCPDSSRTRSITSKDLRDDLRVYLDNAPWGCISCAYGWQAAVGTLGQLRSIGHALRAWPTPLGVAINSADEIWDVAGELSDDTVRSQLDLLATQLLTFARAAWETA
jgi:FMN reductase